MADLLNTAVESFSRAAKRGSAEERAARREADERELAKTRQAIVETQAALRSLQSRERSLMRRLGLASQPQSPTAGSAVRQRRNDRARASVGAFTRAEFAALVTRFGGRCVMCGGLPNALYGRLVPDHIVPLAHGGKDTIDNIQPLHKWCNEKKGLDHSDFREEALRRLGQ